LGQTQEEPRKTSLVDATPQSVKNCLRKLSVQFSNNTVVREVKGLFDETSQLSQQHLEEEPRQRVRIGLSKYCGVFKFGQQLALKNL
jgi:hypothetical protein